jgi:MoaA/NifB/PqqE/SkfB family radical SAM enzyme
MYNFANLTKLHIEITNNCQAKCPMCSRNVNGGIENPLLSLSEWSLDDFKNIITYEVLDQINYLTFCGVFGDPLLNNSLLEMCQYIREYNKDVYIKIHTNGSLRNESWWSNLAKILSDNHLVVFGIDGLEDTHSIYRINTDFKKIITNASTFIKSGGHADWAFIIFRHNEHQVAEANNLANTLGFKNFHTKQSYRFNGDTFPVKDTQGNTLYTIQPPTKNVIKFVDKYIVDNFKKIVDSSEIDCYANTEQEGYIDAYKNFMPCCFLGSSPYIYTLPDDILYNIRKEILAQYYELVSEIGEINLLKTSIKNIVESESFQTVWEKYWKEKKLYMCVRICGKNNLSKHLDQYITNE